MVYSFLLGGLSLPVGTGTNITTRAVCLSVCLGPDGTINYRRHCMHQTTNTHIHALITFRTKILLTAASIENNSFICHTETLNRSEIICPFFKLHCHMSGHWVLACRILLDKKGQHFKLDVTLLTTINTRQVFSLFIYPTVHIISFD
jgi:hypothetical protein